MDSRSDAFAGGRRRRPCPTRPRYVHLSAIIKIAEREQVRHRLHEKLIREYGTWISGHGHKPSTKCHPIDLLLRRVNHEVLVEAKIVQCADDTQPARNAIGQLFEYRYKYRAGRDVHLAVLLNQRLCPSYVSFLENLQIGCVWREGETWAGSPRAVALGMTDADD
jgi:hypothetical protein